MISTHFGVVHAQVVINEIMAGPSARQLNWSAEGIPSLGHGPTWYAVEFSETSWQKGQAPFAFGSFQNVTPEPLVNTPMAEAMNGLTSLYLRKSVRATKAQAGSMGTLKLTVQFNDGFICYINGREAVRRNAGPAHAWVYHDQGAANGTPTYHEAENTPHLRTEEINLGPAEDWLVSGKNIIAVQALNYAYTARMRYKDKAGERFTTLNHLDNFYFTCELELQEALRVTRLIKGDDTWHYRTGTSEPSGGLPPTPDSDSQDTLFADWIELKNSGKKALSLGGWFLSDTTKNLRKWTFPANIMIPPGGYLIVVCDEGDSTEVSKNTGYLHSNFKLDDDGEDVILTNPKGEIIDQITFPAQTHFNSYGRTRDDKIAYLSTPTPGKPNDHASWPDKVAAPASDLLDGHYATPVTVTWTCPTPQAVIRYTLDGSEPTDTNGISSTAGAALTVSVTQSSAIRVRAFLAGSLPSDIVTRTYLISESEDRRRLAAICITADESRSLYRPFGIMAIQGPPYATLGSSTLTRRNGFYWNLVKTTSTQPSDLSDYNAPMHRGRAWERPAHLQFIESETSGRSLINTDIGLRIAGSSVTRMFYKFNTQNQYQGNHQGQPQAGTWPAKNFTETPSFNLYFRSEYGLKELKHNLFADTGEQRFTSLRLRAGKNDPFNPFIKDEFVRRIFISMGYPGSRGLITPLYVNGVYKGYYNLCERLREEFFQNHYQSKESWDVRQAMDQEDGDSSALEEMIKFIRTHPQNQLANYQAMQEHLDVVNFVDYLLLNLVCGTRNWPYSNYVCARERSATGRHRFYVWDAENAFRFADGDVLMNMFETDNASSIVSANPMDASIRDCIPILYTLLRESPEFRLLFADRIQKHLFHDGALTEKRMLHIWNELGEDIKPLLAPEELKDPVTPWLFGINNVKRYTSSSFPERVNSPGRRQVLFDGYQDTFNDIAKVPAQFVTEGLWPATLAPFAETKDGSNTVTLSHSNVAGDIYYTTDGSDPRSAGGNVAGIKYQQPFSTNFTSPLKARVLSPEGEWSPLFEWAPIP